MHIHKAAALEKLVNTGGNRRTHPENGVECVSSHAQVRYCTKIFKRVALFLQRVIGRALAQNGNAFGVYLHRIRRNCGFYRFTRYFKRRSELHIIRNIIKIGFIYNYL